MPRKRRNSEGGGTATLVDGNTEGEVHSMEAGTLSGLFEELSADQWKEQGGGGTAERGLYTTVLAQFVASGGKYAVISMARGKFAGKKASSVSTALKNAQGAKSAPEGSEHVKISSRGENAEKGIEGAVFLENTAIEG